MQRWQLCDRAEPATDELAQRLINLARMRGAEIIFVQVDTADEHRRMREDV